MIQMLKCGRKWDGANGPALCLFVFSFLFPPPPLLALFLLSHLSYGNFLAPICSAFLINKVSCNFLQF